ncbi:hypothetical protein ACLOJK_001739 [Asimina triloba]
MNEGSVVGHWVRAEQEVHLVQGYNELAILSETVGLQNYGAFLEKDGAGLRGQVKLSGLKGSELNLSMLLWTYQVGLKGEYRKIYTLEKQESADWSVLQQESLPSPFTWYKVSEYHYPPLHLWSHRGVLNRRSSISSMAPELDLQCDEGQMIAAIRFASYGTPAGACQSYSQGKCHAPSSVSVVSEACVILS